MIHITKRFCVSILLLFVIGQSTAAAAEGFFHLKHVEDKWVLHDPMGVPVLMREVNHFGEGTHMPCNLNDKHGSSDAWRRGLASRHRQWGFNYLALSIGPSHIDPATLGETKSQSCKSGTVGARSS